MAIVRAQEASSSASHYPYHVFLSFRGEDTRKIFIDYLYTALDRAGLRTFRDNDEIEKGENITSELGKGIRQSRCSIIVFSEDYASSKWCLDELVMILEYRKSSRHFVLPLFYSVDPSDVRKQTGRFAEAFARHEERFKVENNGYKEWMDKVERWRASLKEIADLAGMDFRSQADEYKAKFIKKIVKVIETEVNRTILNVPPYLVGISSHVKDINFWLRDGSNQVGIIAICGMGGIGKTTIAKHAFNLNFNNFEGSSFLANIREVSEQPDGLIHFQRQLLSDILKRKKVEIHNVDEGIEKIKDAICRKRVLLVLDDVDQTDQLDSILGMRDWFYPGSKIIVTTRRMQLLKAHEVDNIHKIEPLDTKKSLQLFCWHAFGQGHPAGDYMELSERVTAHCGGVPLALKVLGSSLAGQKSVDVWESALQKLEAIPDTMIMEKLKISYDSLQDDHDRSLFLEIACFFVGKEKYLAVMILDKCDFYTKIGIHNLIDRCLLTLDKNNKLRMHQLLQEMGREIIRQESPKELGKRSKLWDHRHSFSVLKENMGTETIEGLFLDMHMLKEGETIFCINNAKRQHHFEEFMDKPSQGNSIKRRRLNFFPWHMVNNAFGNSNKLELKTDAFKRMLNLRLLQINFLQLTGGYKEFPKKLRWLCWRGCPLKFIPRDFPLEMLVAIDMRNSNLKQVWDGTKFLKLLKVLNLSHSHGLIRTPDFSRLPNLERLILKHCASLIEVHESIGNLETTLVFLNLEDCKSLPMLPRTVSMLKVLETLIISGCLNLGELPTDMWKMESLKVFRADGITIYPLSSISTSTSNGRGDTPWHALISSWVSKPKKNPKLTLQSLPQSLMSLSLAGCSLVNDAFPRDFSKLQSLKNLDLSRNPLRCLPDFIKGHTRLESLHINDCERLQSLISLPRLTWLEAKGCTSLGKITYESSVVDNVAVNTIGCEKLEEITTSFKLVPIGNSDAKMLNYLGWNDLESLKGIEIYLYNSRTNTSRKVPVQGLYEARGIFSIFFPGSKVPVWFSDKSEGSSLSFTVPSHPNNIRIRGLNVCYVYAVKSEKVYLEGSKIYSMISNETKDLKLIYGPSCYGFPIRGDHELNMVWLSHWKLGSDKVEAGDELNVSIIYWKRLNVEVKEVGIQVVYDDQEEEMGSNKEEAYDPSRDVKETARSGSTRLFGYGTLRGELTFILQEIGVMWDPFDDHYSFSMHSDLYDEVGFHDKDENEKWWKQAYDT